MLAADFDTRVTGTTDWTAASPCEGWTSRDVVAHIVGNHRGMVAQATGTTAPELAADDDIVAAWKSATSALHAVLCDPEKAATSVQSPFGPMPLEQMVGRFICNDVLVHTWDLARATGQDESLNADAVAAAHSGLKPLDAMLRSPGIFGPKVDAPEGADAQTEFLCFLGRAV